LLLAKQHLQGLHAGQSVVTKVHKPADNDIEFEIEQKSVKRRAVVRIKATLDHAKCHFDWFAKNAAITLIACRSLYTCASSRERHDLAAGRLTLAAEGHRAVAFEFATSAAKHVGNNTQGTGDLADWKRRRGSRCDCLARSVR
jgi:hypothetical protein